MESEKEKYYSLQRIDIICGWGMAEDVILVDNQPAPKIYVGMSIEQAKKMLVDLQKAIENAEELEQGLLAADVSVVEIKEREVGF